MIPVVPFFGNNISRLICGGNPFSGFSHISAGTDREMTRFYIMPRLQKALDECLENGINTVQTRGDRHMMRMIMEHRETTGSPLNWIAQIASEFSDHKANVGLIRQYNPIAIYYHGTYIDNLYHGGRMDEALPVIEHIKNCGLPAGIGTDIPEVISFCEENRWPVDFYMASFYNLARKPKPMVAVESNPYRNDSFDDADPGKMCSLIRQVEKPCLGFKILACGRQASTLGALRRSFKFAFDNIKNYDAVVVGMFQKHKNQIAENSAVVREIFKTTRGSLEGGF